MIDDGEALGTDLTCFNGVGGFNAAGEYEIRLTENELPPAPWTNVIANAGGGCIVSETGSGPTWAVNSSFFRLTPWANDPVADPSGDCIYIRDEESGDVWTPTAAPIRHGTLYTVRHGAGFTIFDHLHDDIASSLRVGVPISDAVKIQLLTLTNTGTQPRSLSITTYVEWVLGTDRERSHGHLRTEALPDESAMLAQNTFESQFANHVAFSAVSEPIAGCTSDRARFLGRNGSLASPAAMSGDTLTDRDGSVDDPCAVMRAGILLAPGESRTLTVLIGAGDDRDNALTLIDRYRQPADAGAALDGAATAWRDRLDVIQVSTPEPTFDLILNRWSMYQALSCRMWGRIALYQSSGAYGFRDQLQDSMAFVYAEPELTRQHIVHAASRQFEEGDVQHWWHPDSGRGVRTRFADDLIWLPYVVNHYVRVTGDFTVLDEPAGYVKSRLLAPDEDELYEVPDVSNLSEPVYNHCVRALRRASTTGAHGLPLIGGGDWNDGMNRVGIGGKGESVWLAWFLCITLREFAEHCRERGDIAVAEEFLACAAAYAAAVEATSWDGEWYRRAYYDDGAALGARGNVECSIDAIAQSWSVITGAGDPERAAIAMHSFDEQLVRDDARLLLLLAPPFNMGDHDPGYIRGYLPGVRENGGQYTHAALWSVLATAMQGKGDRALELYQMINPITHASTREGMSTYKVEPYVVAADVYTAEGHLGRGGWTWYTGSASWLYRVGLEAILGLTKRGNTLALDPCIPSAWPGFSINYRFGSTSYSITVRNPRGVHRGVVRTTVDGTDIIGAIELTDDERHHQVVVTMGDPIPQP